MTNDSPTIELQVASKSVDARQVLDALPAAVLVADAAGRIQYRNPACGRVLADGQTLDAAARTLRVMPPFRGWTAELRAVLAEGGVRRFEAAERATGKDSSVGAAFYSIELLRANRRDELVVVQLTAAPACDTDDRTEIVRRLTSLGKMAARVAHELNNPLDGILRYINMALRVAADASQPKLTTYLNESRTGILRMIEIISDLLEYSRATAGAFDEIGINEVVEQAIRSVAERASAAGVVITADFQNMQMPQVRGGRLYQVCCNLLRNAIDAMPQGGRLTIATGLLDCTVIIRVSDTGVGLPDPPEKVFEPFFTTKGASKGTGLGLAICKDFVEGLGGVITAEAATPHGAIFTVRIPADHCGMESASTPRARARFTEP